MLVLGKIIQKGMISIAVIRTVLIIDDNKEDREMISSFLNGDYNII